MTVTDREPSIDDQQFKPPKITFFSLADKKQNQNLLQEVYFVNQHNSTNYHMSKPNMEHREDAEINLEKCRGDILKREHKNNL